MGYFSLPTTRSTVQNHLRFIPVAKGDLPAVSAIIPTLNEAKNLPHVLPRIPDWVSEIVIVDGRSTDNTIEVARQLVPDVRIVHQTGKGKGDALRAGFRAAQGDIIVMLDADGSTDPAEIPAYVGTLLSGADFAKGSRFLQGGGTADMEMLRRMGNLGFVMMVRMLFGGTYTDLCYGYNAFWKRVLPMLNLDGDGFEIETMMNVRALQAGLLVVEVPSFENRRVHGTSNLRTFPDGWRVLKTIMSEWWKKPTARAIKWHHAVNRDDFIPAMQLLFDEAMHLSQQRHRLSKKSYTEAVETIKMAYNTLLDLETEAGAPSQMKNRYVRYYNDESMWQILEAH